MSSAGFYAWRFRPSWARAVRHAWLTDVIREVHAASYANYGAKGVHAELVLGRGPEAWGIPSVATADDLVDRMFVREPPNELWVSDITEHPRGKAYCAIVLDALSRRVVGWSIGHNPTVALTSNALGMALAQREAHRGETVIHSDHGTQFTSWAFTERRSGLVPSMGSISDCYDNAMIEVFWSRIQVELLNTRRWKTRVELADAIFEYIEIFHNRRGRHSSLGMRTPIEYELLNTTRAVA